MAEAQVTRTRRKTEGSRSKGGTDRLHTSIWCYRLDGGTSLMPGTLCARSGFGGTIRFGDVLIMMPNAQASVQQFSAIPTIR